MGWTLFCPPQPSPCGVPYPPQESKGSLTLLGLGQLRCRRDPPRLCLRERPSVTGFVAGSLGLVPLFPGTVARNCGGARAQVRAWSARLGAGPPRCSGWRRRRRRRRRATPPGASGRCPTNASPSVRNQILIVKLNILSVPLAPLYQ